MTAHTQSDTATGNFILLFGFMLVELFFIISLRHIKIVLKF